MALLDMARKKNCHLEVAHMNYHHRDTANRDERIVRKYCRKYKIRFHKADFDESRYKGNFQENARNARYSFFRMICEKNGLDTVLVAHNLDDFLETYFMQKDKKLGVSYYGIRERNCINGVNVYRPLLNTEKSTLEEYCVENEIEYGIDESNYSDIYERNRIRHEIVQKMSCKEKKDLYRDVLMLNKENRKHLKEAEKYLKGSSFDIDYFLNAPYLKQYLHHHFSDKSDRTVIEMIRQFKESSSCRFQGEDILLVKEYGMISKNDPIKDYEYVFKNRNAIKEGIYTGFRISCKGNSFEGAAVKNDDFPLKIRNCKPGDKIAMKYGSKGINRFFIDKKIGYYDRRMWPAVVNKDDRIILVPGIGCDIKHYSEKHNFFVIKL